MAHSFSLSIFCNAYRQAASRGHLGARPSWEIFGARQLFRHDQDLVAEGLQRGVMRVLSMSSTILNSLPGIFKHMSFVPKTNRIEKRFSWLPNRI